MENSINSQWLRKLQLVFQHSTGWNRRHNSEKTKIRRRKWSSSHRDPSTYCSLVLPQCAPFRPFFSLLYSFNVSCFSDRHSIWSEGVLHKNSFSPIGYGFFDRYGPLSLQIAYSISYVDALGSLSDKLITKFILRRNSTLSPFLALAFKLLV